ncbi:MAG: hypothetical protein EXR07_21195 [Acetobacteraceae bacterium]|nr:hypothetical protein [Acetobacteraceae bacterium]
MQRSVRLGFGTGFVCVILPLFAAIGMSARFAPDWHVGGLTNPDSYMRLVRLRDMLDSGTTVFAAARDGSGHGTILHWSHLLDSLLCVLALPFGVLLNQSDALYAAALLFGPLTIAALGFATAWAAAPFADRKWLFLGALLIPLSPAIVSYGMAGVVHHHVVIAVAAMACWGWAARLIEGHAAPTAGIALGAWAGAGVWFTPETVPLTMMAFGALWLAWIVYPARGDLPRAIGLTGLSFALVTLLALLADPPAAGIAAPEIDRLSILFAGLALAAAATGAGLWAVHSLVHDMRGRAIAACAIGFACCGIWAVTFRGAIFRSNMAVDEAQSTAFFSHINEMQPVGDVLGGLHFLLTGALALLLTITLAVRRRALFPAYAAFCLTGLIVVGWTHVRFAAYPEAAGAIALPVALTMLNQATLNWHQIGQSFTRLAAILLFIQVPYLGQLPVVARAAPMAVVPACKIADGVALLAPHAGAVVLADVNDTPELLYKTGVRTVGSLYHRGLPAFLRLRAAWRTPPSETVPPEIDAAEVSLVLACGTHARSPVVEDLKTMTLLDQVRTGQPPSWLRQIDENPISGHVLYEVTREAAKPTGEV